MAPRTDTEAAGNFLIPNGTFFAELLIFLLVLAVLWLFVVPPIRKVLADRENRVTETSERNKEAKQYFAQAEERYRTAMEKARAEAADIRNEARAEGRAILEELRSQAQREADEIVAESAATMRADADQVAAELHEAIEPMSRTLADRVIGIEDRRAGTGSGHRTERA